MLDSYFFIPADKPKFLDKMASLPADYFVIDLEDAVAPANKRTAMQALLERTFDSNVFVRIPFVDDVYTNAELVELVLKFNGRIALPKISTPDQLSAFVSIVPAKQPIQLIILVENPTCFVHLKEMMTTFDNQIIGVGFGSHDFCATMQMKHTWADLNFYRQQLILMSKAFGKRYIDTVDTQIGNTSNFGFECLRGFELGADGKFLIHPSQLAQMQTIEYLSPEEISRLHQIHDQLNTISDELMDVVTIDGVVYEKPHIEKIRKTIKRLNRR